MYRKLIPPDYAPLSQAAEQCDLTANALRIAARKGDVKAVLIRNRVYVFMPDVRRLYLGESFAL